MTEKISISKFQLYVIMFHYMLGPASVLCIGGEANQDAWIAIIIASIIGIINFSLIYGTIYKYNNELSFVKVLEKYFGVIIGKIISSIYVIYFLLTSVLIIRHIYEMVTMYLLVGTPIIVIIFLNLLMIIYAVNKGIETIARAGEIYFFATIGAYISFILFLTLSDVIDINNLFPVLENGLKPVIKASLPLFIIYPFGELVSFLYIFQYLNKTKGTIKTGTFAIFSATIIIIIITILNIVTIGVYLIHNSAYPTMKMIRLINVENIIQRLDSLAVLIFLTSSFFKLIIFIFVICNSIRDITGVKKYQYFIIPAAIIIGIISILLITSYTKLIYVTKFVEPYVSLPFELIIPLIVVIIIVLRKFLHKFKET